MKLLLDTHALIWFLAGDTRLPPKARLQIEDADDVLVSAVSALEVVGKHRRGKLPEAELLALDFEAQIAMYGFHGLAVTLAHSVLAGRLEITHKDPFDRLLIAQSLIEDIPLVSNERIFDQTGVNRIW